MIDKGENTEIVTVMLDFGGTHFRLICVYSPWENNPVAELDNLYESLSMQITKHVQLEICVPCQGFQCKAW